MYSTNEFLQNALVWFFVEWHYLSMMHETVMNRLVDDLHTSCGMFRIYYTFTFHRILQLIANHALPIEVILQNSCNCRSFIAIGKHFQVLIRLVAQSCKRSKLIIIKGFCKGVEIRHCDQSRLTNGSIS